MVILVVEDSMSMRQLVCGALARIKNAIVVEALDAVDALDKLAEIHPDIIMTDINMPQMDGFTFIERLRQRPEHRATPVIVLTTESAEHDRQRASSLGVAAYVTKPIRVHDVVAAVASVTREAAVPAVVLRVSYDSIADLIGDYGATLARGEIVVSNTRVLPEGTAVELALEVPGVDAIRLAGVVRSSTPGDEPTLAIVLVDGAQRAALARTIEALRG
jgi:two-component system chemotaxis response regulator CheY